jgi:hypothetical protein
MHLLSPLSKYDESLILWPFNHSGFNATIQSLSLSLLSLGALLAKMKPAAASKFLEKNG